MEELDSIVFGDNAFSFWRFSGNSELILRGVSRIET